MFLFELIGMTLLICDAFKITALRIDLIDTIFLTQFVTCTSFVWNNNCNCFGHLDRLDHFDRFIYFDRH